VRKFDLAVYLSDGEEVGISIPWGVVDSAIPPNEAKQMAKVKDGAALATGAAVSGESGSRA